MATIFMAKCTITFEDGPDQMDVKVVFDPPLEPKKGMTQAQQFGYGIANELSRGSDETTVEGDE